MKHNLIFKKSNEEPKRGLAFWDKPRSISVWKRVWITLLSFVTAWIIKIIGLTLRWESQGDEHLNAIYRSGRRAIFTFWHGGIFSATWYWRNRDIMVMTSQNTDGEFIARVIKIFGYDTARGSSSRGGMKALAKMAQSLKSGQNVAFTVDGPRGPRFIAKIGPILLARRTGAGVFCFHIALQRKFELKNWDRTQLPLPFSRALILKAPPIYVSKQADRSEIKQKYQEMQSILDKLQQSAENHWEKLS